MPGVVVPRRARSRRVAPGRELQLPPGRRAATQVLEELLVVGEDDELPVGEAVGQELGEPPSVLDVEAVDHVVEHEEAELLVEGLRHGQEQRDRERVQVRLAEHAVRRALARPVELDGQLDSLCRPRLDAHRREVLARVERRIELGDAAADLLQELGQILLLPGLIRIEDAIRQADGPERPRRLLLPCAPGLDLLAESGQHDELRIARVRPRARRLFCASLTVARSHLRISAIRSR